MSNTTAARVALSLVAAGDSTWHPCACECGDVTKSTYTPGHDARLVSVTLRDVKAGEVALHDAIEYLQRKGTSQALIAKFERAIANHLAREQAKADRKAAKTAGKATVLAEVREVKVGRWTYTGTLVRVDGAEFVDVILKNGTTKRVAL